MLSALSVYITLNNHDGITDKLFISINLIQTFSNSISNWNVIYPVETTLFSFANFFPRTTLEAQLFANRPNRNS